MSRPFNTLGEAATYALFPLAELVDTCTPDPVLVAFTAIIEDGLKSFAKGNPGANLEAKAQEVVDKLKEAIKSLDEYGKAADAHLVAVGKIAPIGETEGEVATVH